MGKITSLVAVASWEDRFQEGIEKDISRHTPELFTMFHYKEFNKWTEENRVKIRKICKTKKTPIQEIEVSFRDTKGTWEKLNQIFGLENWKKTNALVDMSTMPREMIWQVFYFLELADAEVNYIYYSPKKYHKTWLSREPGRPRLVHKLSGVSSFGRQTCLLISSGFDVDRTLKLVNFFEPAKTLLGLQTGDQFENERMNVKKHSDALMGYTEIEYFDLDAYGEDHGFQILHELANKNTKEFNLIASSLGPKPSAVALYNLWHQIPDIGLSYAPSMDVNRGYSEGTGGFIEGKLPKRR